MHHSNSPPHHLLPLHPLLVISLIVSSKLLICGYQHGFAIGSHHRDLERLILRFASGQYFAFKAF